MWRKIPITSLGSTAGGIISMDSHRKNYADPEYILNATFRMQRSMCYPYLLHPVFKLCYLSIYRMHMGSVWKSMQQPQCPLSFGAPFEDVTEDTA